MKSNIKNVGTYTIKTTEGVQRGLYFRSPIQKVEFSTDYEISTFSAYEYVDRIKSPIQRAFQILIGNRRIVSNVNKWEKDDDGSWAGFFANIVCCPVYFKRNYRKLNAYSNSSADNIQSIVSYGYEGQWENCAGACKIENTKILLKTGKVLKERCSEYFQYTYAHKVEEMIKA